MSRKRKSWIHSSITVQILFERVLARGRLLNSGILPSVNFTKQKRGAKPVKGVCSRIVRSMNNQTKSQRKATIPAKEENATTIMQWLLCKLYHNWVASVKTRKHWFLNEANRPRETRCQKSWDRFEEYGSLSLRYVKQVSWKRKDHRLGKDKVKNPHQRSHHSVKFEDRSQEETERQKRCARSKAWNLAKNIYKRKEKDKATFYSPAEELVLPVASTKEPVER